MDFEALDKLHELAKHSKRRVIEPSCYQDRIEHYKRLYSPPDDATLYEKKKFDIKVSTTLELYNALSGSDINCFALCVKAIRDTLKDKRTDELRIIYPLDVVVMVILLAKLRGYNTTSEIASFYKDSYLELVTIIDDLPSPDRMLSQSSIKRVMRLFTDEEINTLLRTYFKPNDDIVKMLLACGEQRERPEHAFRHTFGFDGQEVTESFRRGETSRRKKAAIGVTIFDCTSKMALSYKVACKKNQESDAFLELLPNIDVQDKVFVADALNTSGRVSKAILKSGGDFLFNIKSNAGNKELKEHIKAIFNREYAKHEKSVMITRHYHQKEHGRIDMWTVNTLPATLLDSRIKNDHNGVQTIVEYTKESITLNNGQETKITKTSRYYISSLEFTDNNADQILYSILDTWAYETGHGRLDDPKVFNQDATQSCDQDYLSNLLGINKVSYNILTWIRQRMIKASKKKSYAPSYSMVQDLLNNEPVFDTFLYLAQYYSEVNLET